MENTPTNFLRESTHELSVSEGAGAFVSLTEAEDGALPKGVLGLIEGIAGRADLVNRNRRFYSKVVYALAVERAQKMIEEGRFLGEVEHPWYGSLSGASVRFTKLWMEDDLMKFSGVVLDTESGRNLKGLLDGGVGVAVSTRGYGSQKIETMKVDGKDTEVAVIQEDFQLEGIDFVLFPSNPHGAVTHHEQEERPGMEEQMTDRNEEAVEVREGFISREDHEAALTEARESARTEVLEGDEVTSLRTLLSAVVEAVRPLVPELQREEEEREQTEAERAVESLRQEIATLRESLAAAEEANRAAEAERAAAEARAALEARVAEVLEGFPYADLIRDELLALESVDEVEAHFESRKGLITRIAAVATTAPEESGTGQAEGNAPEVRESDADSLQDLWVEYAGL